MSDARFEDADEAPLRLRAETVEDLPVLSALVQDAVAQSSEISWMPKHHRLALLLNRFRWEDRETAERQGRPFERVQSVLVIDGVEKVEASGLDPADKSLVMSLLSLEFEPGADGAGAVMLVFSGDGAIRAGVECLDIRLQDVSKPYLARARTAPYHPEDQ